VPMLRNRFLRLTIAAFGVSMPVLAAAAQNAAQPAAPAAAQPAALAPNQATSPTPDQPFSLRIQANEVNLVFSVTDKRGHFVTGLKQEDFGLLDDGRPPERVLRFVQQTNLPLRIGIMLDTSSSVHSRFQFEQDSASEFLLQTLHQNDRAFVEGFDVQIDLEQDYTNKIDLLSSGIHKLRPGGGTALFDSLYKTCRDQMLTLAQDIAVRKVIILITDGEDNYSRVLEHEAIQECQRASTNIYTISTNISATTTKGDDYLRDIAEATGGVAFFPEKLEEIAVNFKNIQEELRSQYQLVYRPANFKQDGSFRTIYLQPIRGNNFVARVKKGYFAPHPVQ